MSTLTVTKTTTTGFLQHSITPPTCPSGYSTPCAPCYIQASTSTFVYPHPVESITVEATPYISAYQNGSFATSWDYLTLIGGTTGPDTVRALCPSHDCPNNAPSTYPTTYLEYHGFVAAGPSTASQNGSAVMSETCAQASQTHYLTFPSTLAQSSLVVPWTSLTPLPHSLPSQILSYLDQLPLVTSQLGNNPIESCLPLPSCTVASTDPYCYTVCRSKTVAPYPMSAFNNSLSAQPWSTGARTGDSTCATVCPKVVTETVTAEASANTGLASTTAAPPSSPVATYGTTEIMTTASVVTTVTKDPILASNPFETYPSSSSTNADNGYPGTSASQLSALSDTHPTSSPQDPSSSTHEQTKSSLTDCTDALCGLTASTSLSAVNIPSAQAPPLNTDHTPPGAGITTPSSPARTTGVVITLASQTLTVSVVKGSSVAIGSTTISQGQAITFPDSQVVSAGTSALIVGTSTVPLSELGDGSQSSSGVVITGNGHTLTATQVGSGVFAAGSTTFTAGQVVTFTNGAKTTVGSGSALMPGPPAPTITGVVITADSQTITATQVGSGTFVAGTTTFTAGQVMTLSDGETLTVGTGHVISGSGAVARVVFIAGAQTMTATELGSGTFVIDSATLAAGQATTLSDGEVVSVNSAGDLQLGTSTLQASPLDAPATPTPYYVIDGQTLTPGGIIVDGSTTISLDVAGSTYFVNGAPTPVTLGDVEVGGTTYPAAEPQSTGLGSFIMCGLEACSTSSTDVPTSSPTASVPPTSVASRWTWSGLLTCGSLALLFMGVLL
nr:hypothetical protein CFP56_29898 [Quercus suber]